MAVLTPWVVASRDAAVTGVASINGKQGDVTLEEAGIAASGANKDITSLGGLVGPLRLNAQGVDDYDAVTVGQMNAAVAGGTGGGVGASGVVSDFIGAVEWWQGSASNIPSGYVPANGQLLDRSKYPDLWKLVEAGILTSVQQQSYASTDEAWLNGQTSRAFYSKGDDSSTFRVPDLNGVFSDGQHPDSIPGLFIRGSGAANKAGYAEGAIGVIRKAAAPDISGGFATMVPVSHGSYCTGGMAASNGSGVATTTQPAVYAAPPYGMVNPPTQYSDPTIYGFQFAASRSNSVYGQDAVTAELRPSCVTGIWIIRANGNFTSASTIFSVRNSDEEVPDAGTTITTGALHANHTSAGESEYTIELSGYKTMGTDASNVAAIYMNDDELNTTTSYRFPFTGKPSTVVSATEAPASSGITSIAKYFDPRTSTVAPGFYSWSGSPTDPLVANGGWYDYIYLQHGGNGGTNISNYAMLMEISHNGTLAIGQFDATTGTYVTKKQFTSTDLTEALQATVTNLTQRLEEMQVVLKAQNEQMLLLQAKFAD